MPGWMEMMKPLKSLATQPPFAMRKSLQTIGTTIDFITRALLPSHDCFLKCYHRFVSKYLTLLLILALSLPPLQAVNCEMEQGQANQPQGNQHVMDSAKPMAAHHEQKVAEHGQSGNMPDCCALEPAAQNQDCDETMDCGTCSALVSLPGSTAMISGQSAFSYSASMRSGLMGPSHSFPPYRPPIS